MSTLAQRRGARKQYKRVAEMTKPGEGARFAAVEKSAKLSGAKNPGTVAAKIGRAKYGPKKFAEMAAKGRKAGK
jgi:hypothetical protein